MLERSAHMEEFYKNNDDPWGNTERRSYQISFKGAVEKALGFFKDNNPTSKELLWYDLGAGGGNIIDTVLLSNNTDLEIKLGACDISKDALSRVNKYFDIKYSDVVDLERYNNPIGKEETITDFARNLNEADIISLVDVSYLFGDVRDYKETLDEIWETLKPGAILVSADTLIRNFRRTYFSKKEDSILLESYINYDKVFRVEERSNGTKFVRNLKVLIYQKSY